MKPVLNVVIVVLIVAVTIWLYIKMVEGIASLVDIINTPKITGV